MDIGYTGALLGGILTLLSPCSVMLLPAFFAYAFAGPAELLSRTALFYLGLLATLVPLGLLAGVLGALLTQNRGVLVTVAAVIVISIGLLQIVGVNIPWIRRRESAAETSSAFSVFILGTVYGVAGVCAGPILGSVLTVAAAGANPLYGGIMLAIFALGMVLPLGVLALLWGRFQLGSRSWMRPRWVRVGRWENSLWMLISGALSVGIGVLLLVTQGTASLGGVLTIDAQYQTESWVAQAGSSISNVWFGVAAIAILALVLGVLMSRARRAGRRVAAAPVASG